MHSISHAHLSLERVKEILDHHEKLTLSKEAVDAIVKCRAYLDKKMEDLDRPIYGITTGFGSLYNVNIPKEDLSQLQHNLVMSHACGTGEKVRPAIVKLMLLLKVQNLSYGHSGVQLITVQRLAHIRFLIGVTAGRGTTSVLAFVLRSFSCSAPRVVQEVEILFVGVATCTLDPYSHGVRTVSPCDTTRSTGRSLVNGGNTGHICPRLTQREITRTGLRDTHRTYVLVLHHHTIAAVMTGLSVGKVEFEAHLLHVTCVPAFGLNLTVKSGATPILEIRVGHLKIVRISHERQRHQGCADKNSL